MANILIENGTIVNEGRSYMGHILVEDERIVRIGGGEYPENEKFTGERIDARGKLVLPGVIDDQVHFREPGLTHKGDIASESRAAVAGGITSYFEMPNTVPPTITDEELEWKLARAAETSAANFSFYFGATNDNVKLIANLSPGRVCGVKVFMGSSTGNMLVDDDKALAAIFAESPVPVAVHCEDERMVREELARYVAQYGDNIPMEAHPRIRSAEACYRSSAKAVELADKYGTQLHVLHVSTAREVSLFDAKPLPEKKITAEACVHHLWFSQKDYSSKGSFIKWNPAIKTPFDRGFLHEGLRVGKLDVVATDHAPHTLHEKLQPYTKCPSGGPLVQHALPMMLQLAGEGIFSVAQVVEKMCHAPAVRFGVRARGFLREGYYADIAIVDPAASWTVERHRLLYKCGWSPIEGETFMNRVTHTIVNGTVVFRNGVVDNDFRGKPIEFER